MSISEACTIAPTIRLLDHDPQEDLDTLCEIAQQAWAFSPLVGIEPLDEYLWAGRTLHQPQSILLDATGLANFFGGESSMIDSILQWLNKQGYFGVAAMAHNLGSAWAIANYTARAETAEKLLEFWLQRAGQQQEATSNDSDVSNVSIGVALEATECESQSLLNGLSIEGLRIDQTTANSLRKLGVRTIGQLMQLPRSGLASRLGERLVKRLDSVCSNQTDSSESIPLLYSNPDFSVQFSFEIPTSCRATIEEVIRRLTDQLCKRLGQQGHGALRVASRLRLVQENEPDPEQTIGDTPSSGTPDVDTPCNDKSSNAQSAKEQKCPGGHGHCNSWLLSLGLYRATSEASHIVPLLLYQLDQQMGTRRACVSEISLEATLTGLLRWKQTDLFENDLQQHHTDLARLLDLLSCRVGRRNIVGAKLQTHPQPELACVWRPLTGNKKSNSSASHRKTSRKVDAKDNITSSLIAPLPSDPLRRPTRLLTPPQRITVNSESGESVPVAIVLDGYRHRVIQFAGPERIESGWWQGTSERRDYFRLETDRGAWLWIYRNLVSNDWYLHGVF